VSIADWRALIEAYLDGRLSAPAFARRFLDAWRAQRDAAREPIPRAIETLFFPVEAFPAFDADAETINDDDMRNAAQRALRELGAEPGTAPHTFDRTRAREDMRRFQVNFTGCASIGCVIGLAWLALCLLQVYFVVEWVDSTLGVGALIAAAIGFVLAFVPIVGNVLAFLGWTAKDLPPLIGAVIFFAAPAATLLSGWARWRQSGR
jgi:hypothetical protein